MHYPKLLHNMLGEVLLTKNTKTSESLLTITLCSANLMYVHSKCVFDLCMQENIWP